MKQMLLEETREINKNQQGFNKVKDSKSEDEKIETKKKT